MTDKSTGRFLDWLSSHKTAVIIICLAVAGLYLFIEHNTHLMSILPYGLLLLCPIMHLLMHRGHGGHGDNNSTDHSAHHHTELTSSKKISDDRTHSW